MRLAADIIDAIRAVPTGSGDCHMVVLFGLGRGVPDFLLLKLVPFV
jgi:hypothetical protein